VRETGMAYFVILMACAIAGGVVVAVWPREREPVYQGKKLSQWVRYNCVQEPMASGGRSGGGDSAHRDEWFAVVAQVVRYEEPGWQSRFTFLASRLG